MVEVTGGRLDPQEVRRKFLIETGYHFQNKVKMKSFHLPQEEILQMEKTSIGKSLERACSLQHLKIFCVKISLVVEGDRDKKKW